MSGEADADPLIESLQLQAIALTVKAMVTAHPNPTGLGLVMRDLFAQYQATPVYYKLTDPQREMLRYFFEQLASSLPAPD